MNQRPPKPLEIFIDTIITNNEERTVEQAANRIAPKLKLKQYRYLAPSEKSAEEILTTIALFNPNKEIAFVRKGGEWYSWNSDQKTFKKSTNPLSGLSLLRRDEPDLGAPSLGEGSETGVCYAVSDTDQKKLFAKELLEIFANPHASTLEILKS